MEGLHSIDVIIIACTKQLDKRSYECIFFTDLFATLCLNNPYSCQLPFNNQESKVKEI